MGREQAAEYYDALFKDSPLYAKSATEAPWYPLWKWIAAQVPQDAAVLELGCGPGHLASILKCKHYMGIDFSEEAGEMFKRLNPKKEFQQAKLPDVVNDWYLDDFNIIIACEVLEHIEDDLACIAPFQMEGM